MESFFQCLEKRYQNCPTFFTDSLQYGCQLTHNLSLNKKRRPVLIFVHDDNSIQNININPIGIIDYLLEDFNVCPFDITSQSDQQILRVMWNELFNAPFLTKVTIRNCPLLFGACDFLKNTGFDWPIILEISQYLTLNDMINTFSTKIISVLSEFQIKVHVSDPSYAFMNMINQKLHPRQIASVQFNTDYLERRKDIHSWPIFRCVQNLTFINPSGSLDLDNFPYYFPSSTNLLFRFDTEVQSNSFDNILHRFPSTITRLTITTTVPVEFCRSQTTPNTTIEYFRLDISRLVSCPMDPSMNSYISELLLASVEFISKLPNVHSVYFIVNKLIIERLLDIKRWVYVVEKCSQLKKVTMKVSGDMSPNNPLTQTKLQIQEALSTSRQEFQFQVIFS
ncbi:hypothetical protein I4U23_021923 [Adineta vaga]|nr:hypothetical protein I4U23_021923 [Adineta vaga]